MSVGEMCTREVVIVGKDETVAEAVQLMRRHHVGDVVVVEEQAGMRVPVGVLTDRDIVIELLAEDVALDAVVIKDVMSYEPLTAREDEDVLDALERMRTRGVRRMPVVDASGALAGILTVDDILGLLAEYLGDLARLVKRERESETQKRHRP
jgi:CBS domain-containing protein